MINQKYYNDVKRFPLQFAEAFSIARETGYKVKNANHIYLVGLGGSALFVDIINNYLDSIGLQNRIQAIRGYDLPKCDLSESFIFVVSHSGNTEEVLNAYSQVVDRGVEHISITAGGKLAEVSKSNGSRLIIVPSGTQPRLSTGYFIGVIINIFIDSGLVSKSEEQKLVNFTKGMDGLIDEEVAKNLAQDLREKVPVIYATDNNYSLAHVSKIKFNENVKIQSFWNFFPELNHNEMVGFTKILMNLYFIIFKSKFTNERNSRRMEIFLKLLAEKGVSGQIFELKGESVLEEILYGYYFIDHVTYYLAEEYGIDPEPVDMVEDFKRLIVD